MRDFKRAATSTPTPERWTRLRVLMMGLLFMLLLGAVLVRAITLQVFDRQKLTELAQDQYVRQVEVPGKRGDIFDRLGTPLAQSVEVDSIWIDPSMSTD